MKVISSFVLLLAAVTVFASDSPPMETHQVLYLADAGVVVLRLSVVVEGEGPKQCHEKFAWRAQGLGSGVQISKMAVEAV